MKAYFFKNLFLSYFFLFFLRGGTQARWLIAPYLSFKLSSLLNIYLCVTLSFQFFGKHLTTFGPLPLSTTRSHLIVFITKNQLKILTKFFATLLSDGQLANLNPVSLTELTLSAMVALAIISLRKNVVLFSFERRKKKGMIFLHERWYHLSTASTVLGIFRTGFFLF